MKKILPLILIVLFLFTGLAYSEEPLAELKVSVDRVINILADPVYKDDQKSQREAIWKIINDIFDFKMMSRMTVAKNWKAFTPQEQDEFAQVFGRFLGDSYLNKIQAEFSGEKVEYLEQEMLSDQRAVVMTSILRKDVKVPMDYGMILRDNKWKVYDVKIEGVSLMKNYRSQFNDILIKETPRQLIERLRLKINE